MADATDANPPTHVSSEISEGSRQSVGSPERRLAKERKRLMAVVEFMIVYVVLGRGLLNESSVRLHSVSLLSCVCQDDNINIMLDRCLLIRSRFAR